jgi:hypothetical protein
MMCSFCLCFSGSQDITAGKTKTRRRIQRVSEKTVLQSTRSEIPPAQNDMPRHALQSGGGKHQLGRFHEHVNGMVRHLPGWVNKFGPLVV